jgi:hypothetical protein
MDDELIASAAIVHDAIPALAHARERQDVGNTLGVIPHGPVSRDITNQVGGGDSGVAVNIQILIALAHIGEQLGIMENINSQLVVEQNPASRNATALLCVHRGSHGMLLHKMSPSQEVHVVAFLELAFHDLFGDESGGVLLHGAILVGLFVRTIVGHVSLSTAIEACDF